MFIVQSFRTLLSKMLIFRKIKAIAQTTATELLSQPVILLLLVAGIVATGLIPVFQLHDFFDEPGRLPRDGGLAYQLVIGLIIAVVSASSTIHSEITGGTAAAALGKPVSREVFIFGKWLGVMIVVFRFWFCVLVAIILAERIPERSLTGDGLNKVADSMAQTMLLLMPAGALGLAAYFHNRYRLRFCKTASTLITCAMTLLLPLAVMFPVSHEFSPSLSNIDAPLLPVSLLILCALAIYSSIAAALSTFLKAAPALILCMLVMLLGLSADALLAPTSPVIVRFFARFIPNLQSFWMCDALNSGILPYSYVAVAACYSICYVAVALCFGMLIFRRRDVA